MTSPPSVQEKQYHSPRDGVTLNDGVFSSRSYTSQQYERPGAVANRSPASRGHRGTVCWQGSDVARSD